MGRRDKRSRETRGGAHRQREVVEMTKFLAGDGSPRWTARPSSDGGAPVDHQWREGRDRLNTAWGNFARRWLGPRSPVRGGASCDRRQRSAPRWGRHCVRWCRSATEGEQGAREVESSPFIGRRTLACWARTPRPRAGGGLAVKAMASGCPMGLVAGPGWTGRAHGLVPVGKDKICFLNNF
jgi:hypothetical protein